VSTTPRYLYYSRGRGEHGGISRLLRMPSGVGEETQVVPGTIFAALFAIGPDGI
jgi:hypothetical protein